MEMGCFSISKGKTVVSVLKTGGGGLFHVYDMQVYG